MRLVDVFISCDTLQALEAELASHEAVLMGVVKRGHELVTAGHTASDTIDKKGAELMEAWSELSQAVTTRSQLLSDSLAVQQVRGCALKEMGVTV